MTISCDYYLKKILILKNSYITWINKDFYFYLSILKYFTLFINDKVKKKKTCYIVISSYK